MNANTSRIMGLYTDSNFSSSRSSASMHIYEHKNGQANT